MNKNKIKKYVKKSVCMAAVLLIAGCTGNFEDYNTNPCAPTPNDMKGDNADIGSLIKSMIPTLVQGQQNNSQMLDQMIGSEYGGHIANVDPWGNGGNYYTYNPRIGWYGNMFDTTMPQIYTSFFQIRNVTEGKGIVYAWAQILRVAASLKISDCYGPIPYSQISGTAFTVAYDKMEDLYKHMFEDLDVAITTIKTSVLAGEDFSSLAEYDMVYSGNFENWVKFANTLKLRMALRLANVSGEMNAMAQQEAHDAAYDVVGVMSKASDAAYSNYNDGMNPYYRAGVTWFNGAGEFSISANITSYLSGYNDPRLEIYAVNGKNGKGLIGVRNGISQTEASASTYAAFAKPNIGINDKLLIMSASEAYFLRAEAALRGWDVNGTAKELYEQGITVAMDERKAAIGDYLSNVNTPGNYVDPADAGKNISAVSTISPKYDTTASMEANLERILVQKWIASFPNGWEAWNDIRRTGYPKFFPIVNNLNTDGVTVTRGMRRLPFPQSEYNTNKANVEAAAAMLGGADNTATDLWWAKKN